MKIMMISDREQEILQLIAHEYTSKEIAKKLYISRYTAETHRKNLLYKMNVKNTAGLVRKAFESQILKVPYNV